MKETKLTDNLLVNNVTEMDNLIKTSDEVNTEIPKTSNKIDVKNNNPGVTSELSNDLNNLDVLIVDPKQKSKTAAQQRQENRTNLNSNPNPNLSPEDEEEVDEIVLKYGAQHVIKLFIPVTVCLFLVIISLSFITSYQESGGAHLIYTPFNEDSQSSGSTKLWMSIANASIFIGVVVFMTVVLILLYKFKFYRVIHGWLAFSSFMLLFFFTFMFISEVFKQFNLVVDMFTLCIFLWNFGILGMFCIHWKGPLFLQQFFLIFSCIQMALIFIKYLPEWTTWVLLAFISIWDLIAVLCPFGPLRILVETAQSRNDNLFPAMVYSSTLIYTIMANVNDEITKKKKNDDSKNQETDTVASSSRIQNNQQSVLNTNNEQEEDGGFNDSTIVPKKLTNSARNRSSNSEPVRNRHHGGSIQTASEEERLRIEQLEQQQQEEEEKGVKLGLGDFIFYSILVGKASILGDWNTVIACFVAILIGLCLTLVLLAMFHKPLPALPISLLFGLIFYFLTNLVVRPFYDNLTYKQIFI